MKLQKFAALVSIGICLSALSSCSCFSGSCGNMDVRASMKSDFIDDPELTSEGFYDAYFAFDSDVLGESSQVALKKTAQKLSSNTAKKVMVEGHCDERGTEEYNLALGERRAQSAVDYLRALGVNSEQLRTVSYGESRPFVEGQNEEAWAKNRRVHFSKQK